MIVTKAKLFENAKKREIVQNRTFGLREKMIAQLRKTF